MPIHKIDDDDDTVNNDTITTMDNNQAWLHYRQMSLKGVHVNWGIYDANFTFRLAHSRQQV